MIDCTFSTLQGWIMKQNRGNVLPWPYTDLPKTPPKGSFASSLWLSCISGWPSDDAKLFLPSSSRTSKTNSRATFLFPHDVSSEWDLRLSSYPVRINVHISIWRIRHKKMRKKILPRPSLFRRRRRNNKKTCFTIFSPSTSSRRLGCSYMSSSRRRFFLDQVCSDGGGGITKIGFCFTIFSPSTLSRRLGYSYMSSSRRTSS